MILDAANVVDYLVGSGLCGAEPRPGERWRGVDHSRRNRNFSVVGPDGRGFFVKQLRVVEAESLLMLQREATLYWLVANRECFAPLAPLVPPSHGYDARQAILVLGHCEAAARTSPATMAAALGATLARLHGLDVERCAAAAGQTFPRQPPGILTAHRGGPLRRWLGEGQRRLVRRFAARPACSAGLDRLAASWGQRALIHGDLRRDNLLPRGGSATARDRATGRRQGMLLIDWELVDVGDPCWDLGSALEIFLRPKPVDGSAAGESAEVHDVSMASDPGRSLAVLWDVYRKAALVAEAERSEMLLRAVRFAGARLLQSALEAQQLERQPTAAATRLLELGHDLLAEPERYAGRLTDGS